MKIRVGQIEEEATNERKSFGLIGRPNHQRGTNTTREDPFLSVGHRVQSRLTAYISSSNGGKTYKGELVRVASKNESDGLEVLNSREIKTNERKISKQRDRWFITHKPL